MFVVIYSALHFTYLDFMTLGNRVNEGVKVESRKIRIFGLDKENVRSVVPR